MALGVSHRDSLRARVNVSAPDAQASTDAEPSIPRPHRVLPILKSFRPKLPIRFLPASPPPDPRLNVKLYEALYGKELAEELILFSMKQAADACPEGKSLKVVVTPGPEEGIGAFCAPDCPEGYELHAQASSDGGADYACLKIRAPPPVRAPPPTLQVPVRRQKKGRKRGK